MVGRYRSGSSMTHSFFVRNEMSLSLFEPCKIEANELAEQSALEVSIRVKVYGVLVHCHML